MKRVAFIACCKTKLGVPAAAEDLYRSPLFRKSVQWATRYADDWYVLSAEHRLVHRRQVIAPYDRTLAKMDADDQRRWRFLTWQDVRRTWPVPRPELPTFIVLAGELYRGAFNAGPVELPHEAPLAGLGIGRRLAWLDAACASPTGSKAAAGLFD